MTTNYTQFINDYIAAWPDNVSDPDLSSWYDFKDHSIRYNNQKKNVQEVTLDNGHSYQLSLVNLQQSDWHSFVIRCIGEGYISLAGKDSSNVAITSKIPVYGNSILPGITIVSTYNLTGNPVINSLADGSVFQIIQAQCVEDGA